MYETILLPVDLSDDHSWQNALPAAISLCEMYDARLFVITVVSDLNLPVAGHILSSDDEVRLHERIATKLDAFINCQITPAIKARRLVASGKVYQQILGHAARLKADLVIMGTNSAEMNGYLLGSNTARVVRHARCSVMIVRDWIESLGPSPLHN
ncbi:MAG: universal stress protein [Alphaproteobacteria bacterium]|nr:universal stress protein [Alphaproteobacteria bacterium]